jgi:hypothetical protein
MVHDVDLVLKLVSLTFSDFDIFHGIVTTCRFVNSIVDDSKPSSENRFKNQLLTAIVVVPIKQSVEDSTVAHTFADLRTYFPISSLIS